MAEQKTIPKVGEIVIAQVSKIMPFGAYCKLLEYNNLDVFLPIKEVSSGWIKNIHEFIHEGQKLVCKVSFYDKERQTVDVSLKKVTPNETKQKINIFNLEKRLNALFLRALHSANLEPQKESLVALAKTEFPTFTALMRAATENTEEFKASKLPKKAKDEMLKLLETSRKKKRYIVSYIMQLSSYNTKNGASELRGILAAIKEKDVEVQYISAPKYHLSAEGKDYADAESKIKSASEVVTSKLKKGLFEIEKEKLRKEKEDIMSTL